MESKYEHECIECGEIKIELFSVYNENICIPCLNKTRLENGNLPARELKPLASQSRQCINCHLFCANSFFAINSPNICLECLVNTTDGKHCKKCNYFKDFVMFNKNKRTKDGLQNHCKKCQSEYHTKWRTEINRKGYNNYMKNYFANNPDKKIAASLRSRLCNV